MRLHTITLKNFQGIRDLTLDFAGRDAAVYGENATGKSTIVNAYTWLLFGKPATGAKNFTPKTRTADGEAHGLEHSVTAVFEDGTRRVELAKLYKEVYKKKRGSVREEFDGHTTEFFVDGVPVKEKEYTETVEKLWQGDAELARILTVPDYFSDTLQWEKRRAILLEMCGDVSAADIFSAKDELAELKVLLEGRTVDAYEKMMAARRRAINEKLSELPGRLDEAQRSAQDADGIDLVKCQTELDAREEEKRLLIEGRATVSQTVSKEQRSELAGLEADLSEAAAAYRSRCIEQSAVAKEIIADVKVQVSAAETELRTLLLQKKAAEDRRQALEKRRADLLEEYGKAASLVFDESATVCPCCHRPLPEEEVARLREEFNLSKSARLSEINEKGKREASREMIAGLEADVYAIDQQISDAEKALEQARAALCSAERELPSLAPFEETETHRDIIAKINAVRERIADASKTHATALAEQDGKIRAVNERINAIRNDIARYNAAERSRARVEELLGEQKALAKEYEDTERMIWLCDLFVRTKVSMLTERINEHFKSLRFSLFSEQINGGLKEECEVLVPNGDSGAMVPYVFANTAAQINAGIELIEAISEHYGVFLPLFIDNAESVTHIKQGRMQQILLVVSEQDKSLRTAVSTC